MSEITTNLRKLHVVFDERCSPEQLVEEFKDMGHFAQRERFLAAIHLKQ